jgi:hypothetical protein
MDRRTVLLGAGALAIGGGVLQASAKPNSGLQAPSLRGPYVDLTTGEGNMITRARIDGNLDLTKTKYGSGTGIVSGVRPGEALRELFGFEIMSAARLQKQPDGSFRLLHREVIYYTDLATGEIMSEYKNPYTGETVPVVQVVNDPWDEKIEAFYPEPPSYGGRIKPTGERRPYIMNWTMKPGGMIAAMQQINLYYPSALKPDKWPRESAGEMNQVTETYSFFLSLADVQNPAKTSLESNGTWSRITPWLPWMLMGQTPGHVYYDSIVGSFDDIGLIKPNVRDYAEKHHPQMLRAPEEWSDVSLSSLENYALQQKPAPVKP